jgi:hypothetical protein
MTSFIRMDVDGVALREDKALQGLKAIDEGLKTLYRDEVPNEAALAATERAFAAIFASIEQGEEPVDLLESFLVDQGTFQTDREGHALILKDWADDASCDDYNRIEVVLGALGPLFEAGGTILETEESMVLGEYRFHGGAFEYAQGVSGLLVTHGDKERVTAAFVKAEALLPADVSEVLREALERATLLFPDWAQANKDVQV